MIDYLEQIYYPIYGYSFLIFRRYLNMSEF